MPTLISSTRQHHDLATDATARSRVLPWFVAVVALVAAAVVAHVSGQGDAPQDAPAPLTAGVARVLDTFVAAFEAEDLELLASVVTDDFRETLYVGTGSGPYGDQREWWPSWWTNPHRRDRTWDVVRVGPRIVQGADPWFVAERMVWRNTAGQAQYEGIATFVVVDDDGVLLVDDAYVATRPAPLQPAPDEVSAGDEDRADFERWLLGRFVAVGIDPPDVAVTWRHPSPDCPEGGSFATRADAWSGGRHHVTLCLDDPDLLLGGGVDDRWSRDAARDGLHEFAHAWMYDHVDATTTAAFLDRAGIAVWRDERLWGELGVEHAAETMAWGLAPPGDATYLIRPAPPCDELAARFELLTGRPPSTACDPSDARRDVDDPSAARAGR